MIKVFAYQNMKGEKSIKIVAPEYETATQIGGISLGWIHFQGSTINLDLEEALKVIKDYTPLNHRPNNRGAASDSDKEGLWELYTGDRKPAPKANGCFKMFNKASIYCNIGEIDPKKVTADKLGKAIEVLKEMSPAEQDNIISTMPEGETSIPADSMSLLPDEVIGLFAVAGIGPVSSAAHTALSSSGISHDDSDDGYVGGGFSGSRPMGGDNVERALRDLADALGYRIMKK